MIVHQSPISPVPGVLMAPNPDAMPGLLATAADAPNELPNEVPTTNEPTIKELQLPPNPAMLSSLKPKFSSSRSIPPMKDVSTTEAQELMAGESESA